MTLPIHSLPLPNPPPTPTAADYVLLASLNESLIDKEHNLTNHRMGWMMTTQAFLFAAFCLILINQPNIKELPGKRTVEMLLNLIPAFGVVAAVAAGLGIFAAQTVAKVLENERTVYRNVLATIFSYSEMPNIGLRRSGWMYWTRFGGVWPPRLILLVIGGLWILVLLGRFGLSFGIIDRGL